MVEIKYFNGKAIDINDIEDDKMMEFDPEDDFDYSLEDTLEISKDELEDTLIVSKDDLNGQE